MWIFRLRKLNGPKFTYPLLLFSGVVPEKLMAKMGKIYTGKPLAIKSRKELLSAVRPHFWKHLRTDTGDMPDAMVAAQNRAVASA